METNSENMSSQSWVKTQPSQNIKASGWDRKQPTQKKERIERNPAVTVAVAVLIQPTPEPKPLSKHKAGVILGAHKSETLKSFLKDARNKEEIREIIDQANQRSPGEKEIDSSEFEDRLKKIKAKRDASESSTRASKNDPVILRFEKAYSDLKSNLVRIFSDDNAKLRFVLKESAKVQDEKIESEKKFEQKQAWKKEQMKERRRWDSNLVEKGITRPLRSFVLAPHRAPSSVAPQ